MKDRFDLLFSMLDGLWLRRQVEGHLIFGPLSRFVGYPDAAIMWCII
jgi:hypothetical protein